MTLEQATDYYIDQIDKPHGKRFAQTVGRFQEGFLSDCVADGLDDAFIRAVETAKRLMPALTVGATQ